MQYVHVDLHVSVYIHTYIYMHIMQHGVVVVAAEAGLLRRSRLKSEALGP